MLRFAPEALAHPRWFLSFARTGKCPDLTTPNMVAKGQQGPTFFGAYGEWMGTPPPSWEDVAWLREQWGGAFMLKGVSRVDDAKRAVDAGVSAISVSNHGGNNLDGTPATIRALPAVADAVGDQIEVLLDGGIRRGSDVVKAVALGARAVMIGRASLWGLAANGQAGVENVLDIMRSGIESALLGLGHASIHAAQPRRPRDPRGLQPPPRLKRRDHDQEAGSGPDFDAVARGQGAVQVAQAGASGSSYLYAWPGGGGGGAASATHGGSGGGAAGLSGTDAAGAAVWGTRSGRTAATGK